MTPNDFVVFFGTGLRCLCLMWLIFYTSYAYTRPYRATAFPALEFLGVFDGVSTLFQMSKIQSFDKKIKNENYNSIGSSTDSSTDTSGDGDFASGFLVAFGIELDKKIKQIKLKGI